MNDVTLDLADRDQQSDAQLGIGTLLTAVQQTPSARRQRRAVVGIVCGFSVLVFVCLIAWVLAWKSNETTREVLETLDVRRAAVTAMEQLLQAETSQRAYLLTQDENYLSPYLQAVQDFDPAMQQLVQETRNDPERALLAAQFEQVARIKLSELNETINLARAGRGEAAMEMMQTGIGRRTMNRAREVENQLTSTLNRTIKATTPLQALLARILLFTIGLAAMCVAMLSIVMYRDTRRNLQFLEARETALRKLAASLELRVQRRTRALSDANLRFDTALRAARVTVFTQDTDLNFTWISSAEEGLSPDEILKRANASVLPTDAVDAVLKLKQNVLATGDAGHGEVRVVRDDVEKWYEININPLRNDAGEIIGLIGGTVEITERKENESRIRLLMRELTHRSKNLLAVIQAIMRQTASNSRSIEDFQLRFSDRLHALAGSHDLLVLEDWSGASMRELIRSQLGHYSDLVGSQIELAGSPMQIRPDAAQHIGMALHELATNAAKYGALSVPEGRVRITWTRPSADAEDGANCTLRWQESRGPIVLTPTRSGFGRVVIERTVARALNGQVDVSYPETGVVWRLSFPTDVLV